jgi:hypothetical protein
MAVAQHAGQYGAQEHVNETTVRTVSSAITPSAGDGRGCAEMCVYSDLLLHK